MTAEELKQSGEAYAAWLANKKTPIQHFEAGHWADYDYPINSPNWFTEIPRRIKPTPQLVPLEQSDIPLDKPVWFMDGKSSSRYPLESFSQYGVQFQGVGYSWAELLNAGFIWNAGGTTFQPCSKTKE